MNYSRPAWDPYFLNIAKAVSQRADCRRGKYGAVIVKDNIILSTGYTGSEPGGKSCLNGECPRGLKTVEEQPGFLQGNNDYSDCISIHAESNAIAHARQDIRGATIYIYKNKACDMCLKLIKAAGIIRLVWGFEYDWLHNSWAIQGLDLVPNWVDC